MAWGGAGRPATPAAPLHCPAPALPRARPTARCRRRRRRPGSRARSPHHETLKAYVRKLSGLVLEVVESGGVLTAQEARAQGEVRVQGRCGCRERCGGQGRAGQGRAGRSIALRGCSVHAHARLGRQSRRTHFTCVAPTSLACTHSTRIALTSLAFAPTPSSPFWKELDLTGSRDFLTAESAEELLAPMLKPGARIRKVFFLGGGGLEVG